MASKRFRTIVLLVVLIPLVIMVAGAITLKIVFTEERLKAIVVPRMEEATGRPVALAGIHLSVFPSLAVEIDSLQIANRSGRGFSPDPLLSLERLRLSVALWSLLGGRVEVTSLLLERPRLILEVNRDNLSNYSNLAGGAQGGENGTKPSGTAAAMSLFISAFKVEDGVLEYRDYRKDSATRLRAITIDAALDSDQGRYILEGTAASSSIAYGTVEVPWIDNLRSTLDFRMVYEPQQDLLSFERGALTVQQIPLVLSGTMADLLGATKLNLSVGSDDVAIADLFSLIPRGSASESAEISGTGTAQVHIDITGILTDSTEAESRGRIATRNASVQYAGLARPITEIGVLAGFTRTATVQEVHIDTLTAKLGEAPVAMSMRMVGFDNPRIALRARGMLELGRLREFYPLEEGTSLGGTLRASIQLAGPVQDPKQLRASGTMDFDRVSMATEQMPTPLRQLTGSISFNNQVLESKGLSLMLGRSDLTLGFRLSNYLSLLLGDSAGPRPAASLTLQSRHLRTDDIMQHTESADTRAASPEATGGLPLPDLPMAMTVSIDTLSTEKFQFQNVRGSLTAAGGVLRLKDLTLKTFGGDVGADGSLDLRDQKRPRFDLKLAMRALQAGELLTPFTSFGRRLGGTLSMQTTMAGALDDTMGIVPSSLNGNGTVSINDGSLRGFRVNQVVAQTLSLPDLENVTFRNWNNAFTVQDGRLVLRNLVVKALNAEYVVNGSHGLDGTLDYRMAIYLPPETASKVMIPGFAGEALKLFQDETGRLKLDFDVGGSTSAPTLRLDTDPAKKKAEQMANEKLKQEMQKLEETVKDKAGDVLKKLFKPPPR